MASSSGFADYVCEQLEGLGRVQARRMFGGFGLYLLIRGQSPRAGFHPGGSQGAEPRPAPEGLQKNPMFGLIAEDELYLKADGSNRDALLAMGGKPFKPFDDKPMIMSYMSVSADILDDAERLCKLARQSLTVAEKAPAKRPAKPRSRKEA